MIAINVQDADDGGPVPGVVVRQVSAEGAPTGFGGTTNENGDVLLPAPGHYRFQLLGYDPFTANVTEAGGTFRMTFASNELDAANVYGEKKKIWWPWAVLAAALILDEHG